jgi:hypothetical protein
MNEAGITALEPKARASVRTCEHRPGIRVGTRSAAGQPTEHRRSCRPVFSLLAPMIIGTTVSNGRVPDPTSPTIVAVVTDRQVEHRVSRRSARLRFQFRGHRLTDADGRCDAHQPFKPGTTTAPSYNGMSSRARCPFLHPHHLACRDAWAGPLKPFGLSLPTGVTSSPRNMRSGASSGRMPTPGGLGGRPQPKAARPGSPRSCASSAGIRSASSSRGPRRPR